MLSNLNMAEVKEHYQERRRVHVALVKTFEGQNAEAYVPLALGIADNAGNYSAAEHGLWQKDCRFQYPCGDFWISRGFVSVLCPSQSPKIDLRPEPQVPKNQRRFRNEYDA